MCLFQVPVLHVVNSGRGRSCREREKERKDETEMVSIATATLKRNLNKWGWDKVEQTAASEPAK